METIGDNIEDSYWVEVTVSSIIVDFLATVSIYSS